MTPMPDLFPASALPTQRAPATHDLDGWRLSPCAACGGTGEGELRWPDIVEPCEGCNGGGSVLGRVGDAP